MCSVLFLVHYYSCVLFSRLSIIENTQPSSHQSEKLRFDCTRLKVLDVKREHKMAATVKRCMLYSCTVKHKGMICTCNTISFYM